MVRYACAVLLLLQTACLDELYWARPSELTRARIDGASVEALRYEDERPKRIAARRLLEVELEPRSDGRLLATDWYTRLRHRRRALLATGGVLIGLGFGATVLGAYWAAKGSCPPYAYNPGDPNGGLCFDFSLDVVGKGLLVAGVPVLLGGIGLTIAGAQTHAPRD